MRVARQHDTYHAGFVSIDCDTGVSFGYNSGTHYNRTAWCSKTFVWRTLIF